MSPSWNRTTGGDSRRKQCNCILTFPHQESIIEMNMSEYAWNDWWISIFWRRPSNLSPAICYLIDLSKQMLCCWQKLWDMLTGLLGLTPSCLPDPQELSVSWLEEKVIEIRKFFNTMRYPLPLPHRQFNSYRNYNLRKSEHSIKGEWFIEYKLA